MSRRDKKIRKSTPQQEHFNDCGVFVFIYMNGQNMAFSLYNSLWKAFAH